MKNETLSSKDFRRVFRGSFNLSVGKMEGHIAIAQLHALAVGRPYNNLRIFDVFGENYPAYERVVLPHNHPQLIMSDFDQDNKNIWERYLSTFFSPDLNTSTHGPITSLIETNAATDIKHFGRRKRGESVKFSKTAQPSLLRYFVLERNFPSLYMEMDFYQNLINDMSTGIVNAIKHSYTDTPYLMTLVNIWSNHYPDVPFIPSELLT